ncbi:DUF373 family protein [Candidatus Micrarchaeota archaeon]|nr:DUF373 family protein [Candidatus Micrarchaeota archaeon]
MERPLLIICIDRDNDLYEKAKVSGPVIGRENNLQGAIKLSLADPEDPDSNTMFYAVKLYDQLKKDGENVEVVTLTGHKKLGYTADREISEQLDRIIENTNATSAILVSDGASDEEVIPIIKSRIKINSSKIVFVKQAKELEKTYFVLLEKLKDPYYSRIIIGIPAILLLMFSLSSYFGLSWQPVGMVVGIYLIMKGLGIDDLIITVLKDFRFSFGNPSWIAYIGAAFVFMVGLLVSYLVFGEGISIGLKNEKLISYLLSNTAIIFVSCFLFVIIGKSIDAMAEGKKFLVTRYALYSVAVLLAAMILKTGSDWVVNLREPYVSLSDFLITLVLAIVAGYVSTYVIKEIRGEVLVKMKLGMKEVTNEYGTFLGTVAEIDEGAGKIVIQTPFQKKYSLPFSTVINVGESIIVKTSGA